MQLLTCCFTGSRPKNYPWGNDESRLMIVSQQLEAAVREAVSCGYRHFISGMAEGIDLLAAEIVLRLKAERGDISLEAAVPFPEQPARWNEETREQYARILAQCDLVNVIAPSFSLEAYAARDREMVERSSLVIAVEGQPYGGTARTIGYAKQLHRKIVLISAEGSDVPSSVHTKLYHEDRPLQEALMEERQENTRGIGTRIQICKKKDAVTFLGYCGGEAVFCLKTRKHTPKRVTLDGNIITVDGEKRYPLTPEQLVRFQSAKEAFDRDYAAAQRGEGFMRVEKDGEVRYIRRDGKYLFTFIEVHADGAIRWSKGPIAAYLGKNDYLFYRAPFTLKFDWKKAEKEEDLLLLTNDDYIVREIKYLRGDTNEDDVKALEGVDGRKRFFPKKEVYDVCDIEFISFKKQPQSPLHPSLWYDMIVKIDGREYMAVYGWKHETMEIFAEGGPSDIRITPEVFEYIRAWTGGDEFEHFRYPREYRRDAQGNLLYPPKKEGK